MEAYVPGESWRGDIAAHDAEGEISRNRSGSILERYA
jgi:hypothetical protein